MDINSLAHTKWNCKYHIVFAPKYRRMIFERHANLKYKYIVGENLYRNLLKEAKRMQTILNVGANNVNNMITK